MKRIEHGDMRAVLAQLIADGVRVDSIVTDPPYHLTAGKKGGSGPAPENLASPAGRARATTGFMGKAWDGGDVAFQAETWRLCYDLLPPGGHLIAFSGTRTYHRMACAIEDAGFEIRDMIVDLIASDTAVEAFMASLTDEQRSAFVKCIAESGFGGMLAWVYGSGFPKSRNVAKAIDSEGGTPGQIVPAGAAVKRMIPGADQHKNGWEKNNGREYQPGEYKPGSEAAAQWLGFGTALKPAMEPICFARKPLDGTVAANVLKHGTGALNIDACRVEASARPRRDKVHSNLQSAVYGASRNTTIAKGSTDIGRWPANVVHDGSDEVIQAFPDGRSAGQYPSGSRSAGEAKVFKGDRDQGPLYADNGSAARFFYNAKAGTDDRLGSKHPTVKPVDLMRWLIKLVTPPRGVVLDPFAGSGSTAMACLAEGFDFIMVEQDEKSIADIRRRLAHVSGADTPLFGGG